MATIPAADRRVTLSKNPTPQNTLPAQPAAYPPPAMLQSYDPFAQQQQLPGASPYTAWPNQSDTALYGALGLNPNVGINVGPGAMQPDMGNQMMVDDDQTLATMAALNNPGFWDNMMLPGYELSALRYLVLIELTGWCF